MSKNLTVREQYREAYRAVRLHRFNPNMNDYGNDAQQRLMIDLISEHYGMMSLKAYLSLADRHCGITVNWRLRDRLQDIVNNKRAFASLKVLR